MILNWPNRITLLRVLAVPVFVIMVLRIQEPDTGLLYRKLALSLFLAVGIADVLDGYLARRLNQHTRLGAVMDPVADKILLTAGIVMLAFPEVSRPTIAKWLVVLAVSRDVFLIVGSTVLFVLIGRVHISVTRIGRLCTFGLTLLIVTALAAGLFPPSVQETWIRGIMLALSYACALFILVSGYQYFQVGRSQLGAAGHEPVARDER